MLELISTHIFVSGCHASGQFIFKSEEHIFLNIKWADSLKQRLMLFFVGFYESTMWIRFDFYTNKILKCVLEVKLIILLKTNLELFNNALDILSTFLHYKMFHNQRKTSSAPTLTLSGARLRWVPRWTGRLNEILFVTGRLSTRMGLIR